MWFCIAKNLHSYQQETAKNIGIVDSYIYTHWMFQGRDPCYRPPFRSLLAIAHAGDVYKIAWTIALRKQHAKGQTHWLQVEDKRKYEPGDASVHRSTSRESTALPAPPNHAFFFVQRRTWMTKLYIWSMHAMPMHKSIHASNNLNISTECCYSIRRVIIIIYLLSEATNSCRVMFFISSSSFSYSAI